MQKSMISYLETCTSQIKVCEIIDSRHLKIKCGPHSSCNIRRDNVVGAMRFAFARSGQQAQL